MRAMGWQARLWLSERAGTVVSCMSEGGGVVEEDFEVGRRRLQFLRAAREPGRVPRLLGSKWCNGIMDWDGPPKTGHHFGEEDPLKGTRYSAKLRSTSLVAVASRWLPSAEPVAEVPAGALIDSRCSVSARLSISSVLITASIRHFFSHSDSPKMLHLSLAFSRTGCNHDSTHTPHACTCTYARQSTTDVECLSDRLVCCTRVSCPGRRIGSQSSIENTVRGQTPRPLLANPRQTVAPASDVKPATVSISLANPGTIRALYTPLERASLPLLSCIILFSPIHNPLSAPSCLSTAKLPPSNRGVIV